MNRTEAGTAQLGPADALRSAYHLACIAGPDLGQVVPVQNGGSIGRESAPYLVDGTISRNHFRVSTLAKGVRLEELAVKNPARRSWLRSPGPRTVRPGQRIKMGQGTWELRRRPTALHWPAPKRRRAGRARWFALLPALLVFFWLRRLSPLSFSLTLTLLSGVLATAGIVWALRRSRQRKRFDAGFLLLAVQARRGSKPSVQVPPATSPAAPGGGVLWLGGIGRGRLDTANETGIGVVGPNALPAARWLAAQFWLQAPHLSWYEIASGGPAPNGPLLVVAGEKENPGPLLGAHPGSFLFAATGSVESLPTQVTRIVSSRAPVAGAWLQPEIPSARKLPRELPRQLSLADLGVITAPSATKDRWAGFISEWAVPVGAGAGGEMIRFSLPTDGPHALIAGGTGSGKTVALQTWLWSLFLHVPPERLRAVLIDYKAGAGLGCFASAPHTEAFVTDLDPGHSAWVIRRLTSVLQQRKADLLRAGIPDLAAWEAQGRGGTLTGPVPPRLLVVVDEFQAMADEHPELLQAFVRLAAQGRSLGFHLVLTSQRPGRAVTPDLRATVDLRVALRLTEPADALAVDGTAAAAALPRIPGRALWHGKEIQFAQAGDVVLPEPSAPAAPLWPAPLPKTLRVSELERDSSVGVREARRGEGERPVEVSWEGESLLLAGPPAVAREVEAAAGSIAARYALARGLPLHVLGAAPPGVRPASVIPLTDPGAAAYFLSEWPRHGFGVLAVTDAASLWQEFEGRGVQNEAAQAWARLMQAVSAGSQHVVVADTGGTRGLGEFGSALVRLPGTGALHSHSLLRSFPELPALFSSASGPGALSRAEASSPVAGRFLSSHWHGAGHPFVVQLPNAGAPASANRAADSEKSETLWGVNPWPGLAENAEFSWRVGPRFQPDLPPAGPLHTFGVPPDLQRWLVSHRVEVHAKDPARWHELAGPQAEPFLALEPPLELLRLWSARHPAAAFWLKASYPFGPFCGVAGVGSELVPVSLSGVLEGEESSPRRAKSLSGSEMRLRHVTP